jgi:hypothetical protein
MHLAELLLFKVNSFKSVSMQEIVPHVFRNIRLQLKNLKKKLCRFTLEVEIAVGVARILALYAYGRLFCFF